MPRNFSNTLRFIWGCIHPDSVTEFSLSLRQKDLKMAVGSNSRASKA